MRQKETTATTRFSLLPGSITRFFLLLIIVLLVTMGVMVQSAVNAWLKAKTVLTGSKFTIAKACSGKAGDEMVSRANIRMVKANKTTSKNAANIT